MTSDIKPILNFHLPKSNSGNGQSIQQLPIAAIDELADELVAEYDNPVWRRWYCGVINEFGFTKAEEWRRRANEGNEPAKPFSKYITYRAGKQFE